MPLISVIIPAHNEENYIKRTLHSLKTQQFQDHEVIVVTNGCTDGTEEIVKKRESDNLKHFSMPIANVSRARNYGASKAMGDILLFLDADTLLKDDALLKIKNRFSNKHAVATTQSIADIKKLKYSLIMNFKNFYNSTGLYKGCSGALICRRKDFDAVDGYDSELVVKEHRKLIKKLLSKGEYFCINTSVVTSMRRFEKWGITRAGGFWIKKWFEDKFGNLKESDYEKIR
jgi:glycosyltransferase involved in cell wall biosynthesis